MILPLPQPLCHYFHCICLSLPTLLILEKDIQTTNTAKDVNLYILIRTPLEAELGI